MSKTLFFAFILLATSALASDKTPPIEFLNPHGGEVYVVGQTQIFSVRSAFKTLKIELSRDGGKNFELLGNANVTTLKGNAQLSYVITAGSTTNAVLRASATKKDTLVSAISSAFTIDSGKTVGSDSAIAPGSVNTASLADAAVSTPKLADQSVTTSKLADKSVTAEKIGSGQSSKNFILAADGNGGTIWSSILNLLPLSGAPYVLKAGDTMTGPLQVAAAGTGLTVANDSTFQGTISVGLAAPTNGQIDIGATVKSFNFSVKDANPSMIMTDLGAGNSGGFIQFRDTDQSTIRAQIAAFSPNHATRPNWFSLSNFKAGPLVFSTSATEHMRVDATGNVGIATTTPNSTLQVAGSLSLPIRSSATDTALTASDHTVVLTLGATTATLPTAVGIAGRIYIIKNLTGFPIFIATTSAQLIDNAAPTTLPLNSSRTLQSDGANWIIIGN